MSQTEEFDQSEGDYDEEFDQSEEFDEEFDDPMDDWLIDEQDPVQAVTDHLADTSLNTVDSEYQKLIDKFANKGSAMGRKRLCEDLAVFYKNQKTIGYEVEVMEDNLYHWRIKLKDFPDDCTLYQQLKRHPRYNVVHLEILFPQDYPMSPPFIRVLCPRFKYLTGHITIGGSICMQVLTGSGWVPAYSIENLLMQIKAEMVEGKAQLDMHNLHPYSEREAREAFNRVRARYGW